MPALDSNKFPTDFVPVSRALVEELGYQAAYIFGIVWNYCQMETGVCKASHDTIANRAGMSRRSVMDHISKLIEAGYIEDLTPDIRNAPHQLSAKIGVQKLHTKEPTIKEEESIEEGDRCENPAHQNGEGRQKLPSRCADFAHLGRQKLPMNRQSQETESIESLPPNGDGNNSEKWNNANKKIVGDKFLELTRLPLPGKKESGAWWGWLFEIFEMAGRDSAKTCQIMGIVVEYMQDDHLTISSPKSLINLARSVVSGQELKSKNGTRQEQPRASPKTLTPEQQEMVNRLNESGRR